MKNIISALKTLRELDNSDLNEIVEEFQNYTQQQIPKEVIDKFKTCGLSNTDFLTSDFLNKYDLKNLLQIENDKNKNFATKEQRDAFNEIMSKITKNIKKIILLII